jgi:hypothetical protein
MPFTPSDLANVDAAIAGGELSVEVNGKRVTYRSLSELQQARRMILEDIQQAGGQTARRGAYRFTFGTHRGH